MNGMHILNSFNFITIISIRDKTTIKIGETVILPSAAATIGKLFIVSYKVFANTTTKA
jgi:hypothetical protein